MLIVFPIAGRIDREHACRSALESAIDAVNSIATVNHTRRRRGKPEIRFGVGLHEGYVVYGNVGAPDRLDFTVMGPAVNLTARLESLTKSLNTEIVMSAQFISAINMETESRGSYAMKGMQTEQEVFVLKQ